MNEDKEDKKVWIAGFGLAILMLLLSAGSIVLSQTDEQFRLLPVPTILLTIFVLAVMADCLRVHFSEKRNLQKQKEEKKEEGAVP